MLSSNFTRTIEFFRSLFSPCGVLCERTLLVRSLNPLPAAHQRFGDIVKGNAINVQLA
jgi:hypothetical protein